MNTGPVRIVMVVTNDLEGDQRVHKMALTLMKKGWDILVIGRKLPASGNLDRPYGTSRLRLLFNKGPLFYACFNIRVFFLLLATKASLFVANDLDTLPAVWLASRIRMKPLVYDSHEYFTEVPELVGRKREQKIWKFIERSIQPRLINVVTVNHSIARIFNEEYGREVKVVLNFPICESPGQITGYLPPGFANSPLIIYQGAVNKGRGLEQLIGALPELPEYNVIVAGGGDLLGKIKDMVRSAGLSERVYFTGKVPFEELKWYTAQAMVGISLEQDIGLNYRYSLPNKLFDYMRAGLPVVASDLPEISRLVRRSGSGILVSDFSPDSLAGVFRKLLEDRDLRKKLSDNARMNSGDYCWEKQEELILDIFEGALGKR